VRRAFASAKEHTLRRYFISQRSSNFTIAFIKGQLYPSPFRCCVDSFRQPGGVEPKAVARCNDGTRDLIGHRLEIKRLERIRDAFGIEWGAPIADVEVQVRLRRIPRVADKRKDLPPIDPSPFLTLRLPGCRCA